MNRRPAASPTRIVAIREASFAPASVRDDEVLVWIVPLQERSERLDDLLADLTPDERVRAERYRVAGARIQFVTTRAILRRILSALLGGKPADVPISYTGAGKPAVMGVGLQFNVTHTEGLALLALARRPVGIDVERIRPVDNAEGLVGRFFSPLERDQFLALPDVLRPAGFFRGWTCKEALIKASGLSVAYLDGFDVELHPSRPAALLAARHPVVAATAWSLAAWEPGGGYTAAIAVEGGAELHLEERP